MRKIFIKNAAQLLLHKDGRCSFTLDNPQLGINYLNETTKMIYIPYNLKAHGDYSPSGDFYIKIPNLYFYVKTLKGFKIHILTKDLYKNEFDFYSYTWTTPISYQLEQCRSTDGGYILDVSSELTECIKGNFNCNGFIIEGIFSSTDEEVSLKEDKDGNKVILEYQKVNEKSSFAYVKWRNIQPETKSYLSKGEFISHENIFFTFTSFPERKEVIMFPEKGFYHLLFRVNSEEAINEKSLRLLLGNTNRQISNFKETAKLDFIEGDEIGFTIQTTKNFNSLLIEKSKELSCQQISLVISKISLPENKLWQNFKEGGIYVGNYVLNSFHGKGELLLGGDKTSNIVGDLNICCNNADIDKICLKNINTSGVLLINTPFSSVELSNISADKLILVAATPKDGIIFTDNNAFNEIIVRNPEPIKLTNLDSEDNNTQCQVISLEPCGKDIFSAYIVIEGTLSYRKNIHLKRSTVMRNSSYSLNRSIDVIFEDELKTLHLDSLSGESQFYIRSNAKIKGIARNSSFYILKDNAQIIIDGDFKNCELIAQRKCSILLSGSTTISSVKIEECSKNSILSLSDECEIEEFHLDTVTRIFSEKNNLYKLDGKVDNPRFMETSFGDSLDNGEDSFNKAVDFINVFFSTAKWEDVHLDNILGEIRSIDPTLEVKLESVMSEYSRWEWHKSDKKIVLNKSITSPSLSKSKNEAVLVFSLLKNGKTQKIASILRSSLEGIEIDYINRTAKVYDKKNALIYALNHSGIDKIILQEDIHIDIPINIKKKLVLDLNKKKLAVNGITLNHNDILIKNGTLIPPSDFNLWIPMDGLNDGTQKSFLVSEPTAVESNKNHIFSGLNIDCDISTTDNINSITSATLFTLNYTGTTLFTRCIISFKGNENGVRINSVKSLGSDVTLRSCKLTCTHENILLMGSEKKFNSKIRFSDCILKDGDLLICMSPLEMHTYNIDGIIVVKDNVANLEHLKAKKLKQAIESQYSKYKLPSKFVDCDVRMQFKRK